MYICTECGRVFEEPEVYSEDLTPGGVLEGGSFIQHTEVCPYCKGAPVPAMLCPRCEDKYIAVNSDKPFCADCIKDIEDSISTLIQQNVRPDEWDVFLDNLDDINVFTRKEN